MLSRLQGLPATPPAAASWKYLGLQVRFDVWGEEGPSMAKTTESPNYYSEIQSVKRKKKATLLLYESEGLGARWRINICLGR